MLDFSTRDLPIICPFGSARFTYVNTSSAAPIETFVITGEPKAANTILYGFWPPLIVSPHGSHVVNVSVTFADMEASAEVFCDDGRQDVSVPAGRVIEYMAYRRKVDCFAHQ